MSESAGAEGKTEQHDTARPWVPTLLAFILWIVYSEALAPLAYLLVRLEAWLLFTFAPTAGVYVFYDAPASLVVFDTMFLNVVAGVVVYVVARRFLRDIVSNAGWGLPARRTLLVAVAGGLGLWLLNQEVIRRLWPAHRLRPLGPMAAAVAEAGWTTVVAWAAFVVLVAPAIEEIVFRGILYGAVRSSCSASTAGSLVTVWFVVGHLSEAGGWQLFGVLLVGAAALGMRIHSRSIWPAVALHASYNLCAAAAVLAGRITTR